jgi:hypothetical protein
MLWYTLNGITRMLSFVGLFYVFYEVFVAFRPSETFYIAFLPCLPYVILLVVGMKFKCFYLNQSTTILCDYVNINKALQISGNISIQYYYLGGSFTKGILSILGPVIFSTDHQLHSSSARYRSIRRYLQVNSIFNMVIHVWVWVIMTFVVCWGVQCIEAHQLVYHKFWNYVPALLCLQVLSIILLVPFERSFILRRKLEIITQQMFD